MTGSVTGNGRSAVVIGGTGAIGSAIVAKLAAIGYQLSLTYAHHEQEAAELAARFGASASHVDLTDTHLRLPDGAPEVLILNAGVNHSGHGLEATSDSELRTSLEVNAIGPARVVRHYIGGMAARSFGRIVAINSLYGLAVPAMRLSYGMSKFALRALTQCVAQEYAGRGITVNEVCPGPVDSAMLREMGGAAVAAGRSHSIDAYLAEVAAELPVGRLVSPDDVASMVAYLASDAGAGITGQSLRVDGGLIRIT